MREAGIRAEVVPWTGNLSDFRGTWRFWRWLKKHPTEVAHFHHGGRASRAISRLVGVKAVVRHVHGRASDSRTEGSVSPIMIRNADAVIACSQAVADSIVGCHPDVIYAGVAMGLEPPAAPPPVGPLRIGVLGRLISLKKVDTVIEAAGILAGRGVDVQVEIAGSGPEEQKLRTLAMKSGANERIRFLGWRTDVRELLASWDLLAIPSLEEGFPVSALEAMAAARAVVASRVGGLCEQVVDGLTGRLVPPGDTEAFVRSIAELAIDRERLARMGVEGWKRAQGHFSLDAMARKTTELYDRLLERAGHNDS